MANRGYAPENMKTGSNPGMHNSLPPADSGVFGTCGVGSTPAPTPAKNSGNEGSFPTPTSGSNFPLRSGM